MAKSKTESVVISKKDELDPGNFFDSEELKKAKLAKK